MRALRTLLALAALTSATAAPSEPAPQLESSAWQIVSISGKPIRNAPRLEFARGQIFGSTGCNGFEGHYVQRGETLIFRRVIATVMACGGSVDAQERALLALLGPAVQLRYGPKGTLRLSSGRRVAMLRRTITCVSCNRPPPPLALPSLAGTRWAILTLNDRAVSQPDKARIAFAPESLSITLGCNHMGGGYHIAKGGYLVVPQIITTLIGCPDPLAGEEKRLSGLLRETPILKRVAPSGQRPRIRLSSGLNEALLEMLP